MRTKRRKGPNGKSMSSVGAIKHVMVTGVLGSIVRRIEKLERGSRPAEAAPVKPIFSSKPCGCGKTELTTKQIARIFNNRVANILFHQSKGWIKPSFKGGRGRGDQHRYDFDEVVRYMKILSTARRRNVI